MGVPEMRDFRYSLVEKYESGSASKNEIKQFKRLAKTLEHLGTDPKHKGLKLIKSTYCLINTGWRFGALMFKTKRLPPRDCIGCMDPLKR